MPASVSKMLGRYKIIEPIGAGGMGEVWKARDTRLGREVAIKISSEKFSDRFEHEARAVATLNHPNICQIYDVGPNYLVMELVEGERLKGPLPVETALDYARQIAQALEAAHEKGIIHRDLKPGNVMITPQGVVKVLDFGLAKMGGTTQTAMETATDESPTFATGATQAGVIMGTAAYMSPEQAAGTPVDRRTDIWSYGVVLWEMLSGRRLFGSDTIPHTLADVLRSSIDFDTLAAPAPIKNLLRRCLDRDTKMRLRDIGEARVAIATYLADPESGIEVPRRLNPASHGLLGPRRRFSRCSLSLGGCAPGPLLRPPWRTWRLRSRRWQEASCP